MDAIASTSRLAERPPPARSQRNAFGDWRLALGSILGFWLFYAATVVARALLGGDPASFVENRGLTIAGGILLTGGIYIAIALAGGSSTRRRAVVAMIASLVAATAEAGILFVSDSVLKPPQDEFRFQAREGFVVIQKGQTVRIERHAAEPLIITLPKMSELGHRDGVRIAADATVIWLFFFAAWSAFYLATHAQAEALNARRRIAEAESAAQSAQVRALRYQVNPHFLFNTLNSLSALVLADRPAEAESMILKLSAFFRSSLTLEPTADVTLADEIALQRHYLDIETVRFPKRLKVVIDIAPGLEQALLPALLLQPLVENAIKYGVAGSRGRMTLTIAADHLEDSPPEGDRFRLAVTNRTEGLTQPAPRPSDGTGVGLNNVCQRLAARFGDAATCDYGALPGGGFEVRMTLPLIRAA